MLLLHVFLRSSLTADWEGSAIDERLQLGSTRLWEFVSMERFYS